MNSEMTFTFLSPMRDLIFSEFFHLFTIENYNLIIFNSKT